MNQKPSDLSGLGARARLVLETLYQMGEASANELLEATGDKVPSYSAMRSILRTLVEKGYVTHFEEGLRYVYEPTVPKEELSKSALAHLLETFFDNSPTVTMSALLDLTRSRGERIDWDSIEAMIDKAKKEGR